jgi:acyl carrier protein
VGEIEQSDHGQNRNPEFAFFWRIGRMDKLNALQIANDVAEIFSQKLHLEVCSHDSDLFESGVLDSLHLVELVFQLEQQFSVRIPLGETDLENFRSIESIVLMLTRKNGNGTRAVFEDSPGSKTKYRIAI